MKPGKRPTPTKVLKLRGSWRAKGRADDLLFSCNRPMMPRWLTGPAAKEWKRIVPELEKMGILAPVDSTMLAMYCTAFAEWRQADKLIKKYNMPTRCIGI